MTQKKWFTIGIIAVAGLAAYMVFKNKRGKSNNPPSFVISGADWDKKKAVIVDENNDTAFVVALGSSVDLGGGYSADMNNTDVTLKKDGVIVKSVKKP